MNSKFVYLEILTFFLSILQIQVRADGLNKNVTLIPGGEEGLRAHFKKRCVNEDATIITSSDGAISLICNIQPRASQHKFYTDLYVQTDEGTFQVNVSDDGFSVGGKINSLRYGGCVESSWGTHRCMIYPTQTSIQKVINLAKRCDPNGEFCFDIYSDVCIFDFANKSWERACPNLKVISFNVNP
ncbi:hypothetical protein BDF20DRAFT_877463 [Mycotypha africana]|uniref:uncharacterized protein n=1 Tax=Mycotypha africana TaxID=64632 RepID=UPI002301157A|nr:uncharacterized protein BDF20DRAFT_877463 [Mycotypha africana]KAI8975214.1 hypothetical protein BDF20DRAFT_877463 [Mycotypha africana]